MGAACSYSPYADPYADRGSIHMISNSIPSGSTT